MRIGFGYDVHRLAKGRKLILGGIEIPFERGLLGHSDADVLLHAVMDALLGAAALGDIGMHFPPDDERYKDADSMDLLKEVIEKVRSTDYATIVNIDATIMAERPVLSQAIPEMRKKISENIGLEESRISIKATTTEGLGFVGREEGIAAAAVVLIE